MILVSWEPRLEGGTEATGAAIEVREAGTGREVAGVGRAGAEGRLWMERGRAGWVERKKRGGERRAAP